MLEKVPKRMKSLNVKFTVDSLGFFRKHFSSLADLILSLSLFSNIFDLIIFIYIVISPLSQSPLLKKQRLTMEEFASWNFRRD